MVGALAEIYVEADGVGGFYQGGVGAEGGSEGIAFGIQIVGQGLEKAAQGRRQAGEGFVHGAGDADGVGEIPRKACDAGGASSAPLGIEDDVGGFGVVAEVGFPAAGGAAELAGAAVGHEAAADKDDFLEEAGKCGVEADRQRQVGEGAGRHEADFAGVLAGHSHHETCRMLGQR